MKLNVNEFQTNLKKLNKVIQRKPNLLIYGNVLLSTKNDYLYLIGTDGNTIIKVAQKCDDNINILVNHYELVNLLKSHTNEITLQSDNKKLTVTSKNAKSEIGLAPIEKYLDVTFEIPELQTIDPVHFDNGVSFFNKFAKVGMYVEDRPFNKVIYDSVFTDGGSKFCMFKQGTLDILIHILPILKDLSGANSVQFGTDEHATYFKIDNVLLKTSCIVLEKYPDWKTIIPATEYEIKLPRKEVITKLNPLLNIDPVCNILIDDEITFLVQNEYTKGEFSITSICERLFLKVDGKEFLNILGYFGTDEVNIELGEFQNGIYILKFTSEDFDYYMVSL